jgi:hypothetical protein
VSALSGSIYHARTVAVKRGTGREFNNEFRIRVSVSFGSCNLTRRQCLPSETSHVLVTYRHSGILDKIREEYIQKIFPFLYLKFVITTTTF